MEQVNENAIKDLQEGLKLYNTENNVGLKNAWNIIQAEVKTVAYFFAKWHTLLFCTASNCQGLSASFCYAGSYHYSILRI